MGVVPSPLVIWRAELEELKTRYLDEKDKAIVRLTLLKDEVKNVEDLIQRLHGALLALEDVSRMEKVNKDGTGNGGASS